MTGKCGTKVWMTGALVTKAHTSIVSRKNDTKIVLTKIPLSHLPPDPRYFMENVCDRILELDNGRCFMHDFGGSGAYQRFKEVSAQAQGHCTCVEPMFVFLTTGSACVNGHEP